MPTQTYPSSIATPSRGALKQSDVNVATLPTQPVYGNDTTFYVNYRYYHGDTSLPGGSIQIAFGIGATLDKYEINDDRVTWTGTYYLYISKNDGTNKISPNVINPAIAITHAGEGGSYTDISDYKPSINNIVTTAGGTIPGKNGCFYKKEFTVSNSYSGKTIQIQKYFNIKVHSIGNSQGTEIKSASLGIQWPNIQKLRKLFYPWPDNNNNIKLTETPKLVDNFVTTPGTITSANSIKLQGWKGQTFQGIYGVSPTETTANVKKNITIRFLDGNTEVLDSQTATLLATQSCSCNSWTPSGAQFKGELTLNDDENEYPNWHLGNDVPVAISNYNLTKLPSYNKRGYTFKEWQLSDGSSARGQSINEDTNLYAKLEPIEYNCEFVLIPNKNYGSIKDLTEDTQIAYEKVKFNKTFDSSIELNSTVPTWNDNRLIFKGWEVITAEQQNITYQPGTRFDDKGFIDKNTTVQLIAKWEPVQNTVNLYYYDTNGAHIPNVQKYGWNDICDGKTWKVDVPVWEDHAFLGWSTVAPPDFNNNKGVYKADEDLPNNVKQNLVDSIKVSKNLKNYLNWGNTKTYWGIWLKTGKKIKLKPSSSEAARWVDVHSVYYKIDGQWKRVNDIWVKINGNWRHEV